MSHVLNNSIIPQQFNTIVLISKRKEQKTLTYFHPSMCNVYYKIISKVIVNRLKCFFDKIIYVTQNAFNPGRLIIDNVTVAYECLHFMKMSSATKGFASLKIDMSKAFDRVE